MIGATGQIGRAAVRALAEDGYEVRAASAAAAVGWSGPKGYGR